MATGYTQKILDGASFQEFALDCARQFGALIDMRDDPSGIPLRLPEVSTYHRDALATAKRSMAPVSRMTVGAALKRAAKDTKQAYEDAVLSDAQWRAKAAETRAAYEAVLDKILAWEPPSPDHENLKEFMISQVTDSIKHDCDWVDERDRPKLASPAEFLGAKLKSLTWSIDYHEEHWEAEQKRVAERRAWIIGLAESLGIPVPKGATEVPLKPARAKKAPVKKRATAAAPKKSPTTRRKAPTPRAAAKKAAPKAKRRVKTAGRKKG